MGRTTDNITDTGLLCSGASMSIDNVFINSGNNGSATVTVKNDGQIDNLIIKSGQIFDKLGNNFTFNNTEEITLNRGELGNLNFRFTHNSPTVTDSSIYGNDGTCTNMDTGLTCNYVLAGHYGDSMDFDNSNDYISIPDSGSLNTTNYVTAEAWINVPAGPSSSAEIEYIIQKWDDGNQGFSFEVYRYSNQDAKIKLTAVAEGNSNQVKSDPLVPYDTWHHVTSRFNGSTINAYLDGVLIKSETTTGTVIDTVSTNLFVGRYLGSYLNGQLDEVKLWNRSLSDVEINLSMNALEMDQSQLVMWLKFDEGKGVLVCPTDFSSVRVTSQCADAQDSYVEIPICT